MPVCFQLFKKNEDGTVSKTAAKLDDVDKEICTLLGHEYNPKKWCGLTKDRVDGLDWYNIVGLCIAMGRTCDEIKETVLSGEHADNEVNSNIIKVCDYIKEHYDSNSWREFK